MPLALGTVHTCTHLVSKVHTFADLPHWGCLRLPLSIGDAVLPGWGLPSWKVGPQLLVTLAHSTHTTLDAPTAKWAESLSYINWYSLYNKNTYSLSWTDRHCMLLICQVVRCLWNVIHFCAALSKRNQFLYDFLDVGHWAAALCQLMVVLYRKLDAGHQLMALLVGKLVNGCPHTMGPTLGTNFVVVGFTTPFRGGGSCAGPTVVVDRWLQDLQLDVK